ncbi:hypothetical protein BDB01DRAFT_782307 [Pilobolus umbonatus]|nr:hypothetical protein BDB01DRAFT_782307 [Pilobolus umbonatus]
MIESPKTPYKHSYPEEEVEKLSLHSNHLSIDQSHKYWVDNITNATDLTTLTDDLFTSSLSSLSSQCSYTDSMHESDSQDTVPPKVATTTEIYSNHHRPSSYLPTSSPVDMNLIIEHGHQLSIRDIQVSDVILGEGQMGIVFLASYKGQHVACKRRRQNKSRYLYEIQVQRELYFAARLSICRYVNRYLGWVYCHMDDIEGKRQTNNKISSRKKNNEIYVVQRYVPNKDGRRYLDKRQSKFLLVEAVQAAICLFSALTDAHRMNIGIVDLKLENFLVSAFIFYCLFLCIHFYLLD